MTEEEAKSEAAWKARRTQTQIDCANLRQAFGVFLSRRTVNVLLIAGITTPQKLRECYGDYGLSAMLELENFGPLSLREVEAAMNLWRRLHPEIVQP